MKISVVGCGYLGAVHAACMAEMGHDVVGIDIDAAKIALLSSGRAPFFEPNLPEMLSVALETGRLRFSNSIADARGAEVHFVAVGTPQKKNLPAADLTAVDAAFTALAPHLSSGDLVVGKSTVPVGTATRLAELVRVAQPHADLAWNPEFLREGFAVQDTVSPDRLVYGVPSGAAHERATAVLDRVYAKALGAGTPRVVTNYATAELVKVSANAFLATKISFINAMAEIAEITGADVMQLSEALGYDVRIGRLFLKAGVGFGGGCLPKDIRAFAARADELGVGESLAFLKEVDAINLRRRQRAIDIVIESLGDTIDDKKIAVLGLAFKPFSDDIRDSPALDIAVALASRGAAVVATDPHAIGNSRREYPHLVYTDSIEEALCGTHCVVVVTEWPQFRDIDPAWAATLVAQPLVVDGRNCLDAVAWRAAGWTYRGLGRP